MTRRALLVLALSALPGCLEPAAGRLQFRSIDAGSLSTCGQTTTGQTWCWGRNFDGQLGNADTALRDVPFPVPVAATAPAFSEVRVANAYACGLSGGAAWCWGFNNYGNLGIGTTQGPVQCPSGSWCSPVPVPVTGGLTFTNLSADLIVCGNTTTQQVYCWGLNLAGPLVDGGVARGQNSPTPVLMPSASNLSNVHVGGQFACGLIGTAAWCWGHNCCGQLGDTAGDSATPIAVDGGHAFASLSLGNFHSCGLTAAGEAWCWGSWGNGKLGSNSMSDQFAPVAVHGGLTFASLALAHDHTCGITTSGAAYCWGRNDYGQVGDGTLTDRFTPVPVLGGHSFTAISTGITHSCALTAAGDAYCWGHNEYGQLGNMEFSATPVTQPVRVRPCLLPPNDPLAPLCTKG